METSMAKGLSPTDQRPEDFTLDRMPKLLLTELGRLVTRWALLEGIIELLIAGFLGTEPPLLFPITADIPISVRLRHLRQLGKLRLGDPEHFNVLDKMVVQTEALCGFRNYLMHGMWDSTSVNNGVVTVMETRSSRKSAKTGEKIQYCNV
jgi:hypothetical protein